MNKLIITSLFAITSAFAVNAQAPAQTPGLENPNQADIQFVEETHDFGSIPQSIPASYTFVFKNTGKEPLIVTNAAAGCGCTTPDWSKEPIKPGQKGWVKATFNAGAAGPFNKGVTVLSNAKRSTVTLYIKGDVKAPEPVAAPVENATPAGNAPSPQK